ncbi:MAG TPA: hypothetical protein EYP58_03115 [bacterium (Candidatus Stahlbacteria)]|nr:hypothetical protein [Candidatus Stahlbacteria bacterium]
MNRIFLIVLLVFFACAKKQDESELMARVDNIRLTIDDLKKLYPESFIYQLSSSDVEKILEEWINTQILYLEAKELKLDQEDSIKLYLDVLKKTTLAQTLIMREVQKVRVNAEEALRYFEKYKNDFLYAVKFLQIVTPNEPEAQQVLSEIKSGADFKKLAEIRSPRPIQPRFWKRVELPPRFGEEIYQLKPGEITGVVKEDISKSFLIGKILEKKRIKSKVSFEEVSEYIYNLLRFYKQNALYDSLTNALRQKHTIEMHPERIK